MGGNTRAIDALTGALNAIAAKVDLPLDLAADLLKAVDECATERAAKATAAERERLAPLLAAYRKLYDACWNECATVDIDLDGYNGISYEDCNAIEEAAEAVEALLNADST